jgi:hypothetical protein
MRDVLAAYADLSVIKCTIACYVIPSTGDARPGREADSAEGRTLGKNERSRGISGCTHNVVLVTADPSTTRRLLILRSSVSASVASLKMT